MKTISILGSTGSIGKQALEVIDKMPEQFQIFGLCAGSNIALIREQIKKYSPKKISVKTKTSAQELQTEFPNIEVLHGDEGLINIAQDTTNNLVLIAVSGTSGLYPTLAAINSNIDIALANKETLVIAGDLVMQRAKMQGVKIIPVDSEHSAIYQCIKGNAQDFKNIKKITITASGGPFLEKTTDQIKSATIQEALSHPRWDMGEKITIDSATLMNKGLEVIEAHYLFNLNYENIDVVIHPQSIIHGAVEYNDGSVISQIGIPSMHIPIQYALCHTERQKGIKTNSFDFAQAQKMTFETPDFKKFPCLKLAYEAGKKSGVFPATLNGANEGAVQLFLSGKIKLDEIPKIVKKALDSTKEIKNPTLANLIEANNLAKENVLSEYSG